MKQDDDAEYQEAQYINAPEMFAPYNPGLERQRELNEQENRREYEEQQASLSGRAYDVRL